MTMQTPPPGTPLIPETAPFSAEQRAWLNGFFAMRRPGTIRPCRSMSA